MAALALTIAVALSLPLTLSLTLTLAEKFSKILKLCTPLCKSGGVQGKIGRELIALAEEKKKSFVLYFDMYPSICVLPDDQRGILLSAVFEYAGEVLKNGDALEPVLERYPKMTQECRMALRFIAETIRRDTEKWKEKHKRYSEAAKNRWEKERDGNEELRKYIQMRKRTEDEV